MTDPAPNPVRPGAIVAVIATDGRPISDVVTDMRNLCDQHPGIDLVIGTSTQLMEIRAAGDPCGCHRCTAEDQQTRVESGLYSWWGPMSVGMILCPECGNKRCPKAADHALTCSGSNEVGQPGSAYA